MPITSGTDGFHLTYDRQGNGPRSVVLLHGWPGDRHDYRLVTPLLEDGLDVIAPDLRGFGDSDKHPADPATQYGAAGQARSIVALIRELGLVSPVIAGYDVGSRVAQLIARQHPELISALMISPPLPGIGKRIIAAGPQAEFWYQALHRLPLVEELIDGRPDAVRAYLRHFWNHWSGPGFVVDESDLDTLVLAYGAPGAFTASIAWYRSGAGAVAVSISETPPSHADRITTPTHVLWPEFDPLFPREWSDRITEFFSDSTLELVDGVGHFTPLEAPEAFALAVRRVAGV